MHWALGRWGTGVLGRWGPGVLGPSWRRRVAVSFDQAVCLVFSRHSRITSCSSDSRQRRCRVWDTEREVAGWYQRTAQ